MSVKSEKIAILGAGNIGFSIAEGLVKSERYGMNDLFLTTKMPATFKSLKSRGFKVSYQNKEAIKDAGIVLICVQPKQVHELLKDIKPLLDPKKHMIISVVTGISILEIESIIGSKYTIFRAMPNTAISIQQSMTCIASRNAGEKEQNKVVDIFNHLGKAIMIEEDLMSSATVLGACGIAYSMRYIRSATQGGVEIGFDTETAQFITAQTVKGSAMLLLEKGYHPEREIDKVTTPQGATIAGLIEMEYQGFSTSLIKGITTSFKKIFKIMDNFSE